MRYNATMQMATAKTATELIKGTEHNRLKPLGLQWLQKKENTK